MFKKFNLKQFIIVLLTAILAGFGGGTTAIPGTASLVKSIAEYEANARVMPPYSSPTPGFDGTDGGDLNKAKFAAIYDIELYLNVRTIQRRAGMPDLDFETPVYARYSLLIHDEITAEKVALAIDGIKPFPESTIAKLFRVRHLKTIKYNKADLLEPAPEDETETE